MSEDKNSKNKKKEYRESIRSKSDTYRKSKIKWEIRRNEDPDTEDD